MPRSTLPRRLLARRSLLLGLAGVMLSVACGEIAGNPTPTPGKPSPSPSPAPSPSPSPAPARSALLPTPLPSPVLLASPPPLPSPSPSPLPISLRPPGLIAVERRGQILLVDPERAQPTRILVSSPDNSTPRWSPDARSVLVLGGTGTGAELQTVPATGGSPRRVTSNSRSERGAVFSRRGDRLAYALPRLAFGPGGAEDPSDPEEIWVVSLTSGEERRLASGFDPAWSPDGRLLAYATNGQRDERGARDNGVRVVEVDGSSDWPAVALVDLPGDLLAAYSLPFKPAPLRLRAPSWSPDGQRLVASADGHTSLAWTFDERGQGLRPWTPAFEGGIGRARWSPDGTRLAIESRPATGVDVVVIVELATGREARIGGPQAGFQAASPTWAPDARRLAVIASTLPARRGEPQTTALRLFGQDGSDLGELLSEPGLRDPDWGRTP